MNGSLIDELTDGPFNQFSCLVQIKLLGVLIILIWHTWINNWGTKTNSQLNLNFSDVTCEFP